jgi:hypothetical protein
VIAKLSFYLRNKNFGIFNSSAFDFLRRLLNCPSDENNAFGIDGSSRFLHLFADVTRYGEESLDSVGLLAQFEKHHRFS